MELAVSVCGYLVGLPLELLAIAAILRSGAYRQFPVVFVYVIVDFLTTVAEMPVSLAYYSGHQLIAANRFADIYNLDEVISQVLIYSVVMSLIHTATAKLPSRRTLRLLLVLGAVLFAALSLLIHHNPAVNRGSWMAPWMRDLNFCSAILDLALWAMLIASRVKDHRLLLLSGALGIKFTMEAIGESLRQLSLHSHSISLAFTGNLLIMLANLVFLYTWWQAFRAEPVRGEPLPARPSSL